MNRFVALGVLIALLVAGNLWLGLKFGRLPLAGVFSEIAVGLCFAVFGLAAWSLRPRSRTGPWMLVLGFVVLLNNPFEFRLPPELPGYGLAVVVGLFATWLQYAIAGHIVLAYPSGRLTSRADRALIGVTFVVSMVGSVFMLLTYGQDEYLQVRLVLSVVWTLAAVGLIVLMFRRVVRAPRPQRRILAIALVLFTLAALFFLGLSLAFAVTGNTRSGVSEFFRYSHGWIAVLGLPGTFFVGLLRDKLAFASVGTLVGRLERVPASEVEAALGEILHDRTLRVAFPTGSGLVDVQGRPYTPPVSQAVTPLGDTVLLVHDPALHDNRELLSAAASAARLALDNARLNAEVHAQLAEVRASRQRIAAAADHERQRLERDLHDGAQQRFIGLGLGLSVLRGRLTGADRDMADELERELRSAIRELREIAHGIRPAVLTDQGLGPALAGLARRASVEVELEVDVPTRLDPIIEATAYYVASEALQNVCKHAAATSTSLVAVRCPRGLLVEVTDNGRGGALLSGSGLGGLADRVGAVGGTLAVESPSGGGTRVRAELPCA